MKEIALDLVGGLGLGTSLAAQWLRLHVSPTGGTGSIPGQGTKIPPAVRCGQKKKKKKKGLALIRDMHAALRHSLPPLSPHPPQTGLSSLPTLPGHTEVQRGQ